MALHLWILLVAMARSGITASKPRPEVTTSAGTFRGEILTSHSGVEYVSYRGIPYALPPTGNRRFALPEPRPFIEGVYDAGKFGQVCLQHWRELKLGQEDCLYLNVYTPLGEQTREYDGYDLRKVLVFIHGGGFVVGSSNQYLPGDLVTKGKLIVVTFNYRLGWMGFLPGNSSSLPGNVAYWDKVLVLKWVQKNIRYFGGDPNYVTLSGESTGSISTSVLSLSPAAKGLFRRAILLSGSFSILLEPPRTSNNLLQIAADKFGCRVDSLPGNEDAVVACLKQVPAEDFVADFDFPLLLQGTSSGDDLIPRPLSRAVKDVNFLSEIGFFNRDYLVSITADDGYIYVNSNFGTVNTTSLDSSAQGVSTFVELPNEITKSIILEYQKLFGDLEKSVTAVLTDYFYLNQSLHFLHTFRSREKKYDSLSKRQAYFMSFDYIRNPNRYVPHAIDLCYLFDLTPNYLLTKFYFFEPEGIFNEQDEMMKADYIDLVTDFVKTGNPGENLARKKGVKWPPYDIRRKNHLSLSLQPYVGKDFFGVRRLIWEKYMP